MPPARPPTHPVRTLREHVTALEAAITLALANPKKDPVHRLRTSTRRIEAQLELCTLLPGLPDHAKPAKKVRKLLKKLRRTAGRVRDIDVQRSLLKVQIKSKSPRELRKEAERLRRSFKRQRSIEAEKLTRLLKVDQRKLAPGLEDLLDALKPAEDLSLSPDQLHHLTLTWFQHNTPAAQPKADPRHLHAIRKSAKLARYIAEAGDGNLATAFESLQQAGGTWHDLLTLANIATGRLGPKSDLSRTFKAQCKAALRQYRTALCNHPPTLTA